MTEIRSMPSAHVRSGDRLTLWYISLALTTALAVSSADVTGQSPLARDTTLEGTLQSVWADPPTGEGEHTMQQMVVSGTGRSTLVHLSEVQIAALGGLARVNGATVSIVGALEQVTGQTGRGTAHVRAASIRVLHLAPAAAKIGIAATSAVTAAPIAGTQRLVTLLCRFSDTPIPAPASSYVEPYAGTGAGTPDSYFREVLAGQIDYSNSRVLGWYDLPYPKKHYVPDDDPFCAGGNLQFFRIVEDCTAAADADVDFTEFDQIAMQVSSTFYARYAYAWPAQLLTRDGQHRRYGLLWIGVPGPYQPLPRSGTPIMPNNVIAHELLHALGLSHSGAMGSTHPHGSVWDIMAGLATSEGQHTIAWHKDLLGWLPSSRIYAPATTPVETSIVLERHALPPATGYLMARIPIPGTSEFYTLEARRRVGLDMALPSEGILIHRVNPNPPGFDRHAQLIDADGNGNSNDEGVTWLPGETFTDASAAITVRVEEATPTGYRITISAGRVGATRKLTVTVFGSGSVTSDISGPVHCSTSCVSHVADGWTETLKLSPGFGFAFAGWGGDCATWDSSYRCPVSMTAGRSVTATFVPGYAVELRVTGLGGVWAYTQPHPAPDAMFWCDTRDPQRGMGSEDCANAVGWMPRDSIWIFPNSGSRLERWPVGWRLYRVRFDRRQLVSPARGRKQGSGRYVLGRFGAGSEPALEA
jgi:M6 family metalloprotease-like protein